jgi:hypothetical protein
MTPYHATDAAWLRDLGLSLRDEHDLNPAQIPRRVLRGTTGAVTARWMPGEGLVLDTPAGKLTVPEATFDEVPLVVADDHAPSGAKQAPDA